MLDNLCLSIAQRSYVLQIVDSKMSVTVGGIPSGGSGTVIHDTYTHDAAARRFQEAVLQLPSRVDASYSSMRSIGPVCSDSA